jgi:c-di-GMP-binding flagellar brake protein YcgR
VSGVLASAESIWIGVRTAWGRWVEYPTLLVEEGERSFSIHLAEDMGERLAVGGVVLVKASLANIFLLFETEVLAVERKPFPHAVLAAADPNRLRRIPRRQHFRVSAVLPVSFTFERPDARIAEQVITLTATTFDISSGGVGILINRAREVVLPVPHTDGQLALTLDSVEPGFERNQGPATVVTCEARITRIEPVQGTSNVRLGADFRAIHERQRSEVARFVIEHQLALRRRGVLV